MTEKQHQFLIDRGYRKHQSNSVAFEFADFFYQKCFEDKKGKKYFIDLVHYDNTPHINKWNKSPDSWLCHLNINGSKHMTFEQHNVKLEDLDKLEGKCELFFNTMGCEYYELFEQKD